MNMNTKRLLSAFILTVLPVAAHADRPHVVALVQGYTCMSLKQTPQQAMDFDHPPTFKSAPRDDAEDALPAMSLVAVKENTSPVNGYVEVMQWNRTRAWIKAAKVEPYHSKAQPSATCSVAEMSNGHIDFQTR